MRSRLYFILVIFFVSFITGCNRQKPDSGPAGKDSAMRSAQPMTIHTYLTRSRDSSATPKNTTHIFAPTDTIHGVIHTEHAREGTVLLGRWTFVSTGQHVAENTTRLSAGPNISYFDLMNETPWPAGKYKLLISVDSTVIDSAEFAVASKK